MSQFEPYSPEDLDEFWQEIASDSQHVPLELQRSFRSTFELDGFLVETISFRGSFGADLHGWLAYPDGARRLPAFIWIPPYGRESLLPNQYGVREGHVSLSLNLHGLPAFHQEKYTVSRGYFAQGVEEPTTWIFREMILNTMVAVRLLATLSEVDEDRIGAMGMSQGGGMAMWLGAFCPQVKAVCADMPFLGAMKFALSKNAYRYPLKELTDWADGHTLGMEIVQNTVSYFDTLNLATRCKVPTQISMGLKDPACRPEAVEAIFGSVAAQQKRLLTYDWGHDWHPDMVQNNKQWLEEHLGANQVL